MGVTVLIVVLSVMEGLQDEIETRALAFTPHFVITLSDGGQDIPLTEEQTHWPELRDKIANIPGVVAVFPQVTSHVLVQSDLGRKSATFTAVDPGNTGQVAPLAEMLRRGTFDFGEGLNQECVMSAQSAFSLGLDVGDRVHVVPLGSLDKITPLLTMVLSPMQTRSDPAFLESLRTFFDGATVLEGGGVAVQAAKSEDVMRRLSQVEVSKLRPGENELLSQLAELADKHRDGHFSREEQEQWTQVTEQLAHLDSDKEDGRALKSIRDMVLPVDLDIVGIYQPPENMPGPDIFVPLTIAQEMVGYNTDGKNEVAGISVRVRNDMIHQTAQIEKQIRALLPSVAAETPEGTYEMQWLITPWSESFRQWHQMIAKERIMMSFVLSSISVIASFCIMAVMFTVSLQRKREIAVLQALGASPCKIMSIFTWQGVIIGVVGAALGVVLALLVLYYRLEIQAALASINMDPFPIDTHGISLPAKFSFRTFAEQALFAFVLVTLASAVPAFFVSRQDPAKALRSS